MPIVQVPDLLTEGNSVEAEALQHSFLPTPNPSTIFSFIWLRFSTGFHPVIISTAPRRTSQSSQSRLSQSPVKAMQNRSTTGTITVTRPTQMLSRKSSAPQDLDQAGKEVAAPASVLGVSKPIPTSGLRKRADTASTLSHGSAAHESSRLRGIYQHTELRIIRLFLANSARKQRKCSGVEAFSKVVLKY